MRGSTEKLVALMITAREEMVAKRIVQAIKKTRTSFRSVFEIFVIAFEIRWTLVSLMRMNTAK